MNYIANASYKPTFITCDVVKAFLKPDVKYMYKANPV